MLDPAVLTAEVRRIADPTMPGHSWPPTAEAARSRWAAAVATYFDALAAPAPSPGATVAATAAFVAAFDPTMGLAGLEAGLSAFAATIAAAVAPGTVATPPAGPPAWGDLSATRDGTGRSQQIAAAIDSWARTGLTGPAPGPPAIPWS